MCENSNDRAILSVLQEPLPLEPQPFAFYAKRLGISVDQVIRTIREYLRSGVIRRFAGMVKHDRVGFHCNAMVAFEVDSEHGDAVGNILSRFSCISHCYRRTAYPDWPYSLYAMVHARDEQQFERQLTEIKNAFQYTSMVVLPTGKEFKKTHYHLSVSNRKVLCFGKRCVTRKQP
jgi:DNA-binding Lrp family transcriptional regulator